MILLTRPAALTQHTADKLEERGIPVYRHPLLDIALEPVAAVAPRVTGYIVTSQQAWPYVQQCPQKPLYVVGDSLASAVQAAGWMVAAHAPSVAALKAKLPAQPLLYLHGQHMTDPLDDCPQVSRQLAYTAISLPLDMACRTALEDGQITHIAHYSKRSAAVFAGLRPAGARLTACCLSQAIADSLNPADYQAILTARHSQGDDMIDLIVRAFQAG